MTLYYHAILPLYVETAELENPSDYTESTKYLSWERYFTHVLEEHTEGDRAGISQEKIKQTVSLCQSDENIIKVFTGQ